MMIEQNSSVDSSMISRVIYNFPNKSLKIEFKSGALYEYSNVEQLVYDDLCKAESQGKFFNEQIKNNYDHTQLIIN